MEYTAQPSIHETYEAFTAAMLEACAYGQMSDLGGWGGMYMPPAQLPSSGGGFGGFNGGRAYFNGTAIGGSAEGGVFGGQDDANGFVQVQAMANRALDLAGSRDREAEAYDVKSVKILRMLPSPSGVGLDVHVSASINGHEYWGVFQQYGSAPLPPFVSEILMAIKNTVAQKKIVGSLRAALAKWFAPKPGQYKLLADEVPVITEDGRYAKLQKGLRIEVVQTLSDRMECKIRTKAGNATLSGTNYLWFNYWFARV